MREAGGGGCDGGFARGEGWCADQGDGGRGCFGFEGRDAVVGDLDQVVAVAVAGGDVAPVVGAVCACAV